MKKILSLVSVCLLAFVTFFTTGSVTEVEAASAPKVTIKKYSTDVYYAVISGSKYKAANAKMKSYAKKRAADRAKLKKQLKSDLRLGYAPKGMDYVSSSTCKVKYKSSTKVSIACEDYEYSGGTHGFYSAKTFNVYKGKLITLKQAFKSDKQYKAAKKYAKNYVLNRPSIYPFADASTTIAGHEFYWTKTGLTVNFELYEVASFADGIKRVKIPKKYIK